MKYTIKNLNTAKQNAINATKDYETRINEYLKIQYFFDCKSENENAFNDTLADMRKDGFKEECLDCYVALTKRFKRELPKDLGVLERVNVFSLVVKKTKEEKAKEYGAKVLLQHLQIACNNLKKKGLRTKGAKEQISAYGICIAQLKKSYSL